MTPNVTGSKWQNVRQEGRNGHSSYHNVRLNYDKYFQFLHILLLLIGLVTASLRKYFGLVNLIDGEAKTCQNNFEKCYHLPDPRIFLQYRRSNGSYISVYNILVLSSRRLHEYIYTYFFLFSRQKTKTWKIKKQTSDSYKCYKMCILFH